MKHILRLSITLCILHSAFCIQHSAFAAAPQDDSAKQQAAELAQLVRDNTKKANDLIREMADSGRKKDYAKVTNCYEQITALLALKEGAPDITPYRLHWETAKALSANLHLRWADLALKHYEEAAKAAPSPWDKACALFAAASLEYDVAKTDDIKPLVAKIRSALNLPELSPDQKLELVLRYPTKIDPDFDVAAEAWKIAEKEPKLHGKYYVRTLPPKPREHNSTLDPANSSERVLELCRKGLADSAVTGRDRNALAEREVDALIDLERFAEAEKAILTYAATTNQDPRAFWSKRLGDFYVEQAKRYYLPSHEPTLRKALAAYTDSSLAAPQDSRVVEAMCATALTLKDYLAAQGAIERRIEQCRGETNTWVWCQLGRIAYMQEDYAAAVAAFGSDEAKLDRGSRRLYAESLNALGRTEETLAQLEKLEKDDYRSVKDADRYYIKLLKERLGKQEPAK